MKTRLMMVREGRPVALTIEHPTAAFIFMRRKAAKRDREYLWRIDLDARNRVLGYEVVSIGTVTASLVHPREVFKGALLANAVSVIIVHNHPSQDVSPSPEDKEVTRRLQKAGEILGIPLADHLVVADDKYFSFRTEGLL